MSKNILQVKGLTKSYRDGSRIVNALDEVSFILKEGEDLSILGPSGSGKTTLLQLAGGLDSMTKGQVKIQDQDLSKMTEQELSEFRNRTMGFVFQMINLHSFLTAKENIMIPMLIANYSRSEAGRKADELLVQIGMSDRAEHFPKQLSGGEQQRIAVARALANDPKIVFADEPTGKLDKENAQNIIDILEDVSKQNGMSVVMITHDEKIAKRFDRIIRLESGKIKSDINSNKKSK